MSGLCVKMRGYLAFGILATLTVLSSSYPTGPPAYYSVCNNMRPSSLSPHRLQLGNGTYDISTNATLSGTVGYFNYSAGASYSVTVVTTDEELSFKGFLIQAWDPSETRIGTFRPTNASAQRLLDCSSVNKAIPAAGSICHSTRNTNKTQTVIWMAPSSGNGLVDFRFTLVRSYTEFFGPLSAASPDGSIISNRPPLPESVTPPVREPESYRIKARFPDNCEPSKCTVFVGIDTNEGNEDYLDFYMTGEAKAWVAVGFTETPNMFDANVVACNYNPDLDVLEALDTLNPTGTRENVLESVQRNYLQNGSYFDGRIFCSLHRKINYEEDDEDYGDYFLGKRSDGSDFNNLNTSFYLLFGVGQERAARAITPHDFGLLGTPQISKEKVNPASSAASFGGDSVRPALTRTHGILMWIAWPVLACTGIFFAAWMRGVLPNGEWFQVHRALMLASLVFALMGFVAIIAAQYRSTPVRGIINFKDNKSAIFHFIFGIIIIAILVINPLIGLIRCKPDSKNRWIFNIIHGYGLGLLAQTLAITNVGIGIGIFDMTISSFGPGLKIFWVYLIFLMVFVLMNVGLLVYFYGFRQQSSCFKKPETENVALLQSKDKKEGEESKVTQPSNSSFLWGVLLGYLMLVLVLTFVFIILVSL